MEPVDEGMRGSMEVGVGFKRRIEGGVSNITEPTTPTIVQLVLKFF